MAPRTSRSPRPSASTPGCCDDRTIGRRAPSGRRRRLGRRPDPRCRREAGRRVRAPRALAGPAGRDRPRPGGGRLLTGAAARSAVASIEELSLTTWTVDAALDRSLDACLRMATAAAAAQEWAEIA